MGYKIICLVMFFLVLSVPFGSGEIWCANNDTATIEIFELCLNESTSPCLGWTVNLTLYNPDGFTINYTIIMNETGGDADGFYNTSFPNPGVIGKYKFYIIGNDSSSYSVSNYETLEIMDYCPGEGISDIISTMDLNWSQLWDYYNCTNATSDLNDICYHLDTIVSDVGDIEDVVTEIEDDTSDIKKDVMRIKVNTEPEVTGWNLVGNWIMENRYYLLFIIGIMVFFLFVLIARKIRDKNNEYKGGR